MRPPHESLLLELSEESFHLWRHNPVTAAYLRYLGDQVEAFRTAAADLLEAGNLDRSDVIRGRLMTLRELQNLSLDDIRNFYRHEDSEESHAGTPNKRDES
jgi:hypothetical protein